jgi:type I restriction enzyme R subunit
MTTTENLIERDLVSKLEELKYVYRSDIRDRAALERNFREKFDALNRVRLTDSEFQRLLEGITTHDAFAAANVLRGYSSFERDDGTPLN